ncbi:MAG: chemotaxis protein CheD [Pseudomonadota bacterium]
MGELGMSDVMLLPGEYFVGGRQFRIRTLLGSCVSITLWHPDARVGAMSHYLLARHSAREALLNARYGEDALELMLAELALLGVHGRDCHAKVFGGGQMFPGLGKGETVGHKNGEAARKMLKKHAITLVSESLYGSGHRQIVFNVRTGDVWSRQVDPGVAVLACKPEKA